MANRKSEIQKASSLRKLKRDGKELTPDQTEWLDRYEGTKRKAGRPPAGEHGPRVEPDDRPPPEPVDMTDDSPNNLGDTPIPPPDIPVDLPMPPRVMVDAARPNAGGAWQNKYRSGEKGGSGREHTCTMVASYWLGALKNMADALRAAGIEPIIDPDSLGASIVLTVDEVLPDHIEVTPRMHALGGSTAIAVQRFIRRDEIAKSQKVAKEREQHEEWKANRRNPSPPTDIASHPDFKPKEDEKAEQPKANQNSSGHVASQSQAVTVDHPAVEFIDPATDPNMVI